MMSCKIEYFQYIRGLAIIFVTGIHAFGEYWINFSISSMDGFNYNILIRSILGYAVPVFLALSGYFMSNKDVSTIGKYFNFEKKQIFWVYFPCLIWSFPFLKVNHT